MTLEDFFKQNTRVALGFSGGVDSSYLLWAALRYALSVQPYYIKTPFQPQFEYEDAMNLCKKLGAELKVIEYDILSDVSVAENPSDRCYHCKKALFTLLKSRAAKDGFDTVLDGTNFSDDISDRPGYAALKELSVCSPLRECGLTKDKIRELSKEAGLFTWDKPAYACLATRIPTGRKIENVLLEKVEICENYLMKCGFSDFRVRLYGGGARLQLKESQFALLAEKRLEITAFMKQYFDPVLLDLEGR
ncbi:MAG: ATP-dependent sacrificial sulfur transferase LarE [Clostridia bacterium]|nr:ATP-dependent sacrificial sulfur transferase LarE [Clostridia bacterium]